MGPRRDRDGQRPAHADRRIPERFLLGIGVSHTPTVAYRGHTLASPVQIGRANIGRMLRLPNYAGNLRRLGFADEDFADGGSDRLIDALVAWGHVEDVRRRVKEHLDAGADHVALQVLTATPAALPLREWRELAALLH